MRARRFTLAALAMVAIGATALGTTGAVAQPAPSYAVLTLIGDRMTVVTRQAATGSLMERTSRQELEVRDDVLDVAAATSAQAAIKVRDPAASVTLFAPRDARLYALQDRLAESDEQGRELAASLREVVKQSGATRVLVISKYRADARVRFEEGTVGTGKLSGVGFYIDGDYQSPNSARGMGTIGFFAPYAHLRATLLDAATLQPLAQAVTRTARPFTAEASNSAAVAWDALTPAQKIKALREVIDTAVRETVADVLRPR